MRYLFQDYVDAWKEAPGFMFFFHLLAVLLVVVIALVVVAILGACGVIDLGTLDQGMPFPLFLYLLTH